MIVSADIDLDQIYHHPIIDGVLDILPFLGFRSTVVGLKQVTAVPLISISVLPPYYRYLLLGSGPAPIQSIYSMSRDQNVGSLFDPLWDVLTTVKDERVLGFALALASAYRFGISSEEGGA